MGNFIKNSLSSKGEASSKRLISFWALVVMTIGFLANLFFGFKIEQFIYESMQWIVMVGLGTTASEVIGKFSSKKVEVAPPTAPVNNPPANTDEPVIN